MQLEIIRKIATDFRRAIESIPPEDRPIGFESFPIGSRGDSSLMLGTYLSEFGQGPFAYVNAWRGQLDAEWSSHAWLSQNGIIVDITADGLDPTQPQIIVGAMTDFHRSFKIDRDHCYSHADVNALDGPTMSDLKRFYAKLKASIGRG